MAEIYESGENYLETILILSNKGISVHSIDVAREMNFSKPSISRAMGILKEKNLIEVDSEGVITLTDGGKASAERIYERHLILTEWLTGIGVDEKTAAEDACKLEHDFSDESFRCLKKHIEEKHKSK